MQESYIISENLGAVTLIRLNRPKSMNALCRELIHQLNQALDAAEENPNIGCIILTGNEKAFAAGADIQEMKNLSYSDVFHHDFISSWERLARCRKPVIAAVAGYALGGGCEMAMMCDIIVAADTAKFGQPEITIGTIPGAGGSQRLTRLIGKTKAMDMCLTGRMMSAEEAERSGLVSRIFPADQLLEKALEIAQKITSFSFPVSQMVKESINRAEETSLSEGIRFERRLFHSTFALDDQKEGMAAFTEKRVATFRNK